ncbi:tetratricopeptide repeat-containing sensor histidine kinase [Pedobacter sp. N23S346]|uniref:tetratricopeptide repeat-containing sensor histidine kinase n=1 Tax=Pedobacter sp. N23S346 TaxID=3402750 RepID=UPI003ABFB5BE
MKNRLLLVTIVLGILACNKKQKTNHQIDDIDYVKAESFMSKNNDSAFYYFNKVATSSKDSLQIARAYNEMAIIQADAGDYFGSQETLLTSLNFLHENRPKDFSCLASNYNELGATSLNIKNYDAAILYYDLAIKFTKNSEFKQIISNNKAVVYQKNRNYQLARKIYNNAISTTTDNKEYARILSNLAKTKWLQNEQYNAAPDFLKALEIRIKEKDEWGLNASYSHLSDFYFKKNLDSAIYYSTKMYKIARNLDSPDDQLEALQKLIKLSPTNTAKQYFEIYASLSDSLQTARNAAKNQFALVRYETEKHKADNLKLQKENGEKKYQIIIISSVALFILVGGIFWYRKRKRDIEIKSQKAITDSKLKTSKKVHDVVANGLYRVMTEIENQQDLDRDHVLDKIEDLYEKSRDISYEKPTEANKPFHEILSAILTSFATENRKVLIAGNDAELWLKVSEQTKYELEHIIQELMVNMKKHSQASNVVMRFENNGEQIKIYYTDNGVGMPKDKEFNNGLRNTGNRIEEINGAIIFDTEVEKGLKIQISFPIS